MKQKFTKLSDNEKKFLICLLENGNLTDTAISKAISVSKATISRIRKKLEEEIISDYIPIIELDKVGINIFLVLTFQWGAFDKEEITKKFFSDLEKDPKVVFLANGESPYATTVIFMGFENIEAYHEYFKEFRKKYSKYIGKTNALILPSKEVIKNDFTEIIKHALEVKIK